MGWGAGKGAWSSQGDRGERGWSSRGEGWSEGRTTAAASKGKGGGGKGSRGKEGGGGSGSKPTDDPNFVKWSEGMVFSGSSRGVDYLVEAYVASGTFSRVFKVREVPVQGESAPTKRRWGGGGFVQEQGSVLAAKIMRSSDSYIQYTSSGPKEGELLQKLEQAQRDAGKEVLSMRCLDSFATKDDAGEDYWCLILEWLDASLFDLVRANGNRGLHLSMVQLMLKQLFEQLKVLQDLQCTHTDIKHKNCCLADTEHYMAPVDGRPTLVLTHPVPKFIDYGNAVFEGEPKTHPIHTKQFRAPEVLLNIKEGWAPPSDTWTLGITAAYLVSGQLIFNSHEPQQLLQGMVEALGPFPARLLESAKDSRLRRAAEKAASEVRGPPKLGEWLGLAGAKAGSPEAACVDLLIEMLRPDPAERISAAAALQHPFLVDGGPGSALKVPDRPPGVQLKKSLR